MTMTGDGFKREFSLTGVNLTQKALLAKHLSVMLNAGMTLSEALTVAIEASSGRLKHILKRVRRSVESGLAFSSALTEHAKTFAGIFTSAVYAGERSGNLSVNLANLSRELEKERALLAKVRSAMFYPAIVLTATISLGLAIAFFILPQITPLFVGLQIDLPWTTRFLISLADFIERRGLIFLLGLLSAAVFFPWLWRRRFMAPLTHWLILRLPVCGRLSFNLNLTRSAGSLGLLLKSGVSIDEALSITGRTVSNFYYRRALNRLASDVGRGLKLSDGLARFPRLFPPLFRHLVRVGETSGRFEETLFYLSDFYEGEVDSSTKTLSTALEPILLLIIGLVVAGLALSIITPIYQLTGGVGR